jgi:hypothetical protein
LVDRVTTELTNRFQWGGTLRADLNLVENQTALDGVLREFHRTALVKSPVLSHAASAAVPVRNGVM